MLSYDKKLMEPARQLRKNQTLAEQRLWGKIRRKQILDVQFYRQRPLMQYIVDFYAPTVKLVIEADGGQHVEIEHRIKDQERDQQLIELGLNVLRFDNLKILYQMPYVLDVIFSEIQRIQSLASTACINH